MKKDFVSLAEARPDLAKEWNYEKNGDLKPKDVSCGSNKKVWWKLPYDVPDDYPVEHLRGKHFDFEWQATIKDRNRGLNCPFLSGRAVWKNFNDLQTVNQELAQQWHPTKNGNLKPADITAGSGKKVWWLLPYDVPMDYSVESLRGKHFDFEWIAVISDRKNNHDCPYLSGNAVWTGFNDLKTRNPELAAQWHPTKNGKLKPTQVTANSHKKVWWLLSYDVPMDYPIEHLRGKHFNFEWQAIIKNRNNGIGCIYLSGKSVWKGFNDLQTVNPELAQQWHTAKNRNLKPTQVTSNSHRKVWWILSYDIPGDYPIEHLRGKHFDFEWESTIAHRNNGRDCPYLNGKAVWPGFNDIATINPELAAQWHPVKNGNLKPTKVTIGSKKKVWWILPYDVPDDYPIEHLRGKHFDFEWKASANERNYNGCPYFSGKATWEGFNDLQTVNPTLAKEWHPTKNRGLKSTQVTVNSNRKVWWLLSYEDHKTGKYFNFEWQATVYSRNQGVGCPYLTIYKGEEYIKQYLEKNNISFNVQQRFSDLRGIGDGQLSYDFSMPDKKYGYILIEYNGIQHYESVEYWGGEAALKKQKEHDKRKRDYTKKHGYKLITVKYTYDTYESVEEYLDKELKKLGVINDTKKEEAKKEENVNDAA